jgi:hypothetical protein
VELRKGWAVQKRPVGWVASQGIDADSQRTLIHSIGVQPNSVKLIVRLRSDDVSLTVRRNLECREESVVAQ